MFLVRFRGVDHSHARGIGWRASFHANASCLPRILTSRLKFSASRRKAIRIAPSRLDALLLPLCSSGVRPFSLPLGRRGFPSIMRNKSRITCTVASQRILVAPGQRHFVRSLGKRRDGRLFRVTISCHYEDDFSILRVRPTRVHQSLFHRISKLYSAKLRGYCPYSRTSLTMKSYVGPDTLLDTE